MEKRENRKTYVKLWRWFQQTESDSGQKLNKRKTYVKLWRRFQQTESDRRFQQTDSDSGKKKRKKEKDIREAMEKVPTNRIRQ